ncbi:MAG TPA: electron transfer flavoprotein subunit alpha/FixB family protein [Acidimicrobiia bacterium]|nr:electron transfer flavoprotein subunit alpha/FixB family protein [Acidimicrobiia bacterium]
MVLVVVEHDRGRLAGATLEALTAARRVVDAAGGSIGAVVVGEPGEGMVEELARHGAGVVHVATHPLITDYGPLAWGETVAQLAVAEDAPVVMAAGTDRGNEVMAHVAASMDLPMAANCLEVRPGTPWAVTRVRWGGSLLEEAELDARVALLTMAEHAIEPEIAPVEVEVSRFTPALDESVAHTIVADRVVLSTGVTLATAPVVVGGGRGVGSAEGFAALEELAELLGGVVGCSRVVTNNGWRPHSDQVGQTGTRIAPEIYIACGISGAIQHWVGAMASKRILAINNDSEANMVAKADYAIVGDLHVIVPAIVQAVREARGQSTN